MILFLTSLTSDSITGKLFTINNFTNELRLCFPLTCKALQICSDPNDPQDMDYYAMIMRNSFEQAHLNFTSYKTLDGRNEKEAKNLISEANLIILSGGHVPTQNKFFHKIGLRKLLKVIMKLLVHIFIWVERLLF